MPIENRVDDEPRANILNGFVRRMMEDGHVDEKGYLHLPMSEVLSEIRRIDVSLTYQRGQAAESEWKERAETAVALLFGYFGAEAFYSQDSEE